MEYDIFLNGSKVASSQLDLDQFILGNAQVPLKFPITVSLEGELELMKAVARAFTGTPLAFQIEGKTVFTSQSYEFESRKGLIVQGETLARESVQAPQLRLSEDSSEVFFVENAPVIRAVIQATNPGEVGYFLYGKDVTVSLNGEVIALQDVTPVPLPAGQDSRFELLFYPNIYQLSETGRLALDAALEGIPTSIDVDGKLLLDVLGVDTFEVPNGWALKGFVYK
jgi:hypothetical protein